MIYLIDPNTTLQGCKTRCNPVYCGMKPLYGAPI